VHDKHKGDRELMKKFYSLSLTQKKSRNREGSDLQKKSKLNFSVKNTSEFSANKIKFQKIKNDLLIIQNKLNKLKGDLKNC